MNPPQSPWFYIAAFLALALVISGFVLSAIRIIRGARTPGAMILLAASGCALAWFLLTLTSTNFGPLFALAGALLAGFAGFALAPREQKAEPPKNDG